MGSTTTDSGTARLVSRDAVLYDAIQRTYRPAVIRHLRSRLTQAYGDDAVGRLKRALGDRLWEDTSQAATRARQAGVIKGTPKDAFDLLDVSYFHVVFERE